MFVIVSRLGWAHAISGTRKWDFIFFFKFGPLFCRYNASFLECHYTVLMFHISSTQVPVPSGPLYQRFWENVEISFAICVKFSSLPSHLRRMFVSFASIWIVQKTCVLMVQSVWHSSFWWFKAFDIVRLDRSKSLAFLVLIVSGVSECWYTTSCLSFAYHGNIFSAKPSSVIRNKPTEGIKTRSVHNCKKFKDKLSRYQNYYHWIFEK